VFREGDPAWRLLATPVDHAVQLAEEVSIAFLEEHVWRPFPNVDPRRRTLM